MHRVGRSRVQREITTATTDEVGSSTLPRSDIVSRCHDVLEGRQNAGSFVGLP